MIPDSIEFPDPARYILFVLLGELPLQASSDMAFSSSMPYDDKSAQVLDLRNEITDLLGRVDGALPPQVAASFKEALAPLTGAGGPDLLGDLAGQIRQVSDNRVKQSQKIMESKFEIIAEALVLLAELAVIAALSVFTGGLSFSQAAVAKARTTVAVLTIMQRLLNQAHLLPALSEALQEALTTLAVRLAMLSLNDGKRRPDGIDGRDILKALAVGGLAGFFGSAVSKYIGDIFKNQFRNFGDNKWGVVGGNVFRNAAAEGPSEAFAEFLVNGLFDNRWKFDLMSMAGGSISAVTEMILSGALDQIAKGLNSKFFDGRNVFGAYNPPFGPDSFPGGGGNKVVVHTPGPAPDTTTTSSSGGPGPAVTTGRSLPPPVPVHHPVPPVVVPPLVSGTPVPVLNTLPPTLPVGGLDPFRADSPLPGGESPYTGTGTRGDSIGTTTNVVGPRDLPVLDLNAPAPATSGPGTGVPLPHTAPGTGPSTAPGPDRAGTGRPAGEAPDTTRRTGSTPRQTPDGFPQETPAPESATTPPVTRPPAAADPVRPEQWRSRQDEAPATVVRTEIPAAQDPDESAPGQQAQPTTVDTEVRRVQADDGRWVRSLSLDIPVRPGPGLTGVDLDDLQERVRVLLDTEVNHGLLLPRSGDQLHVDLSVLVAPNAARAVELSATDRPAPSDQQHIRLYGDDPGLSPADRERRRADNAVIVLRQLLRHAGLAPTADPATGPLLTPQALRTAESVTDTTTDTRNTTAAGATTAAGPETVPPVVRPSLESDGPLPGPSRPRPTVSESPDRTWTALPDGPRPLVTALGLPPASPSDTESESDSESESGSESDSAPVSRPGHHPTAPPRAAGLIVRHRPDYMLTVGSVVGRLLYSLGHPAVLAGDARSRVQFGNPRPLLSVDFHLVATDLPAADDIGRELERMPGEPVVTLPRQDRAGTVVLMVNGVEVRIGVGPRPSGFDTAPGFTLPSAADSLAAAALALATAPDRSLRDEALFDLLWALSRTPAEGPRAAALIGPVADAYRAAAPSGAAPVLSVQLSELLDAALNPETLHQHEVLWSDNEASEDDEPRLTGELVALATELRALPEVAADPVRTLATRLPGMPTAERTKAIAGLTPDQRERLAAGPALVNALRSTLTPADFATTAADLIIQIPNGVHQPVSARESARTQVALLLHDPEVTSRLVRLGSRVVVVPRDRTVTSLEAFHDLKDATSSDGRCFHTMRGVATLHAAISEENLLGEHTTIGRVKHLPDGYSATFHEVAHIVHRCGLDFAELGLINEVYRATDRLGEAGAWPDGALYSYDEKTGERKGPNYSSQNQYEFFAQLTNVYLRANTGNDPVTGAPRENGGPDWVKAKHPSLYRLMRRLYGPGPERSLKVNPVEATQALNEGLAHVRALLRDGYGDSDSSDTDTGTGLVSEPGGTTVASASRAGAFPPLALPAQPSAPAFLPHPDPVLEVGQYVALALHGLGRPAVLAGAARGVVQFGNPSPLNAVDFQLVSAGPPPADDIRRALERELPEGRITPLPGPDGGGTVSFSVDGITVRIASGGPPVGSVTADGFPLPAPAASVTEAALALATGSDRDLRGRDLLDLLWALSRTPADGSRAAALARAGADAYRAAALPGAAPLLSVQLSELLDAALDPDTLAGHEQLWQDLGVDEADLPGLRAELTALAAELRALPEVVADPVRTLATRLPGMPTAERTKAIAGLTPDQRERLAAGPALVNALRSTLTPADFATTAADLIIQIPNGVHQPVSARKSARTEVALLFHDPEVTSRLVKGGSRVVVVPRDEPMTSLGPFKHLKGRTTADQRPWDDVRGAGLHSAAVTEENLLGEQPGIADAQPYHDGYSTTVHEVAHTLHMHGLDAADQQLILDVYRATDRLGEAGAWPDGALYSYDAETGERSAPNYSSLNEYEFFAQLTNVYLRANGGTDEYTGLPRNNGGPKWVEENQPGLHPLLLRLYGPGPKAPPGVNPVDATDTSNEALARARALWDVAEGEPGDGSEAYEDMRALWDGSTGSSSPPPGRPDAPATAPGGRARKYDAVRALWHAATGTHRPQEHPVASQPAADGGKKRYRAARALWHAATGSNHPAAPPSPVAHRRAGKSTATDTATEAATDTATDAATDTATGSDRAGRGDEGPPRTGTTAPADLPELSAYARSYGQHHDGHIGLVLFERTPQHVLDGLHRQITDALGVPDGTPEATALRARVAGLLSAEDIEEHRADLRSGRGHRITVEHGGRERTVDVRLAHRNPRHSARYYGGGAANPPDVQVERRAEGTQVYSGTESWGTHRTVVLPWSLSHSVGSGPLRWGDVTVITSLTHNQLTQSLSVGEAFQTLSKHNAKDPARPLDLDGLWQVRVDAPGDAHGPWQPEQSHSVLTGWFPEHRVVADGTDRAGLPEPGPLDDLPLWGVESIADPRRLLSEVLADPAFAELRALGPGSAEALEDFFAERVRRGTALPQTDGGVFSTVLADTGGQAVGVVQLIAHITPQQPLLRAPEGKLSLESFLGRGAAVEQSAQLSSGIGVEAAGGPTFMPGRKPGDRSTAPGFGIGLLGRAGGAWKVDESRVGTVNASLLHGGFTTGSQLLTPATVRYEVVLHRAGGGRVRAAFGPWTDGLHLLVPPRDAMTGHRPRGAEVRALPERLEQLGSIGLGELPFRVESPGLTAALDRAEAWLRAEGFLPPVTAPAAGGLPVRLDEPLRRAQLANLTRWSRFRSRYGIALAVPEAVDGGHLPFLEKPSTVAATRRVRLKLSVDRDSGRPSEHVRRLPQAHPLGFSSYEAGGSRRRGTALSGSGGGGFLFGFPVAGGAGTVSTGPEYTGTAQSTDLVSVGDVTGLEQLLLTTADGGDVFTVPARFRLDLYEGDDNTPLIRFADGPAGTTTGTGTGTDGSGAPRPGDPEALALTPLGAVAPPHAVPGTVSLFVRHHITLPAGEAPLPADRPGHVVRRPVTDGSAADDLRRLGLTDTEGRPLPGVAPLPAGALVDSFRGTAALTDVLSRIVAGTHPGSPGPWLLTRAVRSTGTVLSGTAGLVGDGTRRALDLARRSVPSRLPGPVNQVTTVAARLLGSPLSRTARTSHLWGTAVYKRLSVAAFGAARNAPGTLAAETRHTGIRPGLLLARAGQILGGQYVLDGLTLHGTAADQVLQVTVQGYLHHPRYLGSTTIYSEQSVLAAGSAVQQHGTGRAHQFTGAVTGLQTAPADPDEAPHLFNPSLRHSYTRRGDTATAHTANTKVTRVATHTGSHHLIGSDVTLLVTVRRGVRNAFGNAVGLGEWAPVTVAVDLPRAVTFLAPEAVLARYARWYALPGGAALPALPAPSLPLPDAFARTGVLGLGTVLSLTQLDDLRHRAEQRDRLGTELFRLVEDEAPGATRPGHASHLPEVAPELARRTEPAALRTLPGLGAGGSTLQFVHVAYGGARLVEVVLAAEPVLRTAGLRGLLGRPVETAGLELVQTHAPQNRSVTRTITRTQQTAAAPVSRFPRPGVSGRTDRQGPTLALTHQRVRTVRNDRTGEDRLWTRSDTVADFDGVDYLITASVRSRLLPEWPANLPGGLLQAGLRSFSGLEGPVSARLAAWAKRLLAGRPVSSVSVPAATVLRFAGSEAAAPQGHRGPLPPGLHIGDPLLPGRASGPAAAAPPPGALRLTPTGPVPVHRFNAAQELVRALREVAPGTTAAWGLSADSPDEAVATRLGELLQTGRIGLDGPRTAAGLTPRLPGSWPLADAAEPPVLSIAFYDPRPVTSGDDVAVDRVRRQGRSTTATASAGGAFAFTQQSTHSLTEGNRQLFAFSVPLAAQQPHTSGYGGTVTGTGLNRLRTGRSTAPADRRGTRNHETLVDVVITVHGPEGVRWVTGSAAVRLGEHDLFGFGVTPARPLAGVYDVPALLAGQTADDLRDWARHPVADLPAALAAGLDAEDPAARLWLALGDDHDGSGLAHAVYAASRTAVLAGRPVEVVVRTADGPRHWPFAADGTPADITPGTRARWQEWQETAAGHDDAVAAQEQSADRERDLTEELTAFGGALRESEAALTTARTAHETARAAHHEAVAAAGTALQAAARTVREAEEALVRAESAVRAAEALPTARQADRARLAWRQADAEARGAERYAPDAPATARLRERAADADRERRELAAAYEGRAAAVAAARTAVAEAAGALDRARAEQDRVRREGEAAVAGAARAQSAAERAVTRRTRLRDRDLARVRDTELALRELRAEQPAQAARQTAALRALARHIRALDTVRRTEGTGASGSLLGSLSAVAPAAPGRRTGQGVPVSPAGGTVTEPEGRGDSEAPVGPGDDGRGPVRPGGLRRAGDGGAVLDGVAYALRPVPVGPGHAVAVVSAALRELAAAGPLPGRGTGLLDRSAGAADDNPLDDRLDDGHVPPLDRSVMVPVPLLERAGQVLTDSQRAQGALLGDVLPAGEVAADPAVRLRLLLADPALADPAAELPLLPLLTAAANALGVVVAVAEADGRVVRLGGAPGSVTPYALLLHDGDRWFAGPQVVRAPAPGSDSDPVPDPGR
ncbi:hypothetical protein ACWD4V_31265 [Streptomyces tsukubensis]